SGNDAESGICAIRSGVVVCVRPRRICVCTRAESFRQGVSGRDRVSNAGARSAHWDELPVQREKLMREPVLFCWSGGKDSAMALHTLLQREDVRPVGLMTTVTEGYERISMHGVRRELLWRQAESIGLPLHEVLIPPQCVNPIYEARMEEAMGKFLSEG